jgi:hypothetical protein
VRERGGGSSRFREKPCGLRFYFRQEIAKPDQFLNVRFREFRGEPLAITGSACPTTSKSLNIGMTDLVPPLTARLAVGRGVVRAAHPDRIAMWAPHVDASFLYFRHV